jgi:hypothetical protein
MATCSITDSFAINADTFYRAVEKARKIAEDPESSIARENLVKPMKVTELTPEEIKILFGDKIG